MDQGLLLPANIKADRRRSEAISKRSFVVENINLSWNEITERSLIQVELWKNIWPDLRRSEDIGHCVDKDEIVKLAKQTGLDELNVEDAKPSKKAARLSQDELKELAEQEEKKY